MKEHKYKFHTCFHCGNKGLMRIEHIHNYNFGGPVYDEVGNVTDFDPIEKYHWHLLSCPVCEKITLYEECDDNSWNMTLCDNLYPKVSTEFSGVPENINSALEAALKVKNIDPAICLLSLRRVLEAICKDNHAEGHNLASMISDMISKKVLPDMFSDICWIIKELGNSTAHADNKVFYMNQVEQTIEFIKTIIDYLYILPNKAKTMRNTIERAKENKETKLD